MIQNASSWIFILMKNVTLAVVVKKKVKVLRRSYAGFKPTTEALLIL